MIDDALRTAAYERGIEVRLMGSHWEHSPCDMRSFLESLGSWNNTGPKNGIIKTVSVTLCYIHVCTTCVLHVHKDDPENCSGFYLLGGWGGRFYPKLNIFPPPKFNENLLKVYI